jgi:hypothetical protein
MQLTLKAAKQFSPQTDLIKVCQNAEANPIAIANAMDEASQREWRGWLPETIRSYVGLRESDVQQLDKLMAVQVVLTNPDVFEEWTLFQHVLEAFNHRRVSFEWLEEPDYIEAAWAVHCIHRIDRNLHTLHPDVQKYIGCICIKDGLLVFPWSNPKIVPTTNELFMGLVPEEKEHAKTIEGVEQAITNGLLDNNVPDEDLEVTDTNTLDVQISKILAAQRYFHMQKPEDPGEYT